MDAPGISPASAKLRRCVQPAIGFVLAWFGRRLLEIARRAQLRSHFVPSCSGSGLSLPVHLELDERNASVIADSQHSRKLSGTAVVSLQVPSERGSRKGDAGAARMCRRSERCGQIGFTAFLEHLRGVITRFDQSGATAESFGRCRWDL